MRVGDSARFNAPGALLVTTLLVFSCGGLCASPGIVEIATAEDTPSQPASLPFEGLKQRDILLRAKSSNPALLPDKNVEIRASGRERTITATPAPNEAGTALISISATDGLTSRTQCVKLTVSAVNDAPTISRIPDQIIPENGALAPISFTIGDVETPAASLTVTATSSDTSLLPSQSIVLSGTGAIRTIAATPGPGRSGTVRATVTVFDGEAATTRDFEMRIGRVNLPPVANAGPDQTLLATNEVRLNGTATDDAQDDLVTSWSVVSGPSNVEFANATSLNTSVRFGAHGVYTLRLTACDGQLTDTDDVTIVVSGGPLARVQEMRRKRR